MGEGFRRFKRLYLVDAIVKALVACISVSLLVVATFLIVIGKGVIDFQILYASSIGIGSGLLLGLVTFLLSYKRGKRLARFLDEKLELNEKVQTMYAFREDDGGLKEIQREETRQLLANTPLNLSLLIKAWIVFAALFVLATSYFVVALVMYIQRDPTVDSGDTPPQGDTSNPGDEPGDGPSEEEIFEPTDHHRKELEQLIEYVNKSMLNENAKAIVVTELRILLGKLLDSFGTDDAMKQYVGGVIGRVSDAVNSVNTTYLFYQSAKDLGNKTLDRFNKAFYTKDITSIEAEIDSFYKSLLFVGENELRPASDLDAIKDEIDALKNALTTVLDSSGLKEEDPLYKLTAELVSVFNLILEKSASTVNVNNRLNPVLNGTYLDGLKQIFPQERVNEDVKNYTISELARIFGIDLSSLDGMGNTEGGDYAEPDAQPPESNNGGSYGDGGKNFPSNDKVIDPESNEIDINKIQVEYGDIISRYMTEIKNKIEKGEYSEELAAILNEYFKLLTTPKQ